MARRPSAGPLRAAAVTVVSLGALAAALGGPTPPGPGVASPTAGTAAAPAPAPGPYGPFAPDPTTATATAPAEVPAPPAGDAAPVAAPAAVVPTVADAGGALPARVRLAYERAAASVDPACGLQWSLLAGIGHVESGHARGGRLDATGRPTTPIIGLPLDGGPAVRAIADSDGGRYDGDTVWDRAVGPMQFIPGTWAAYGTDGDGDGRADPHQIDDAAHAAARYLCAGGADLTTPGGARSAVLRYNLSSAYADRVLLLARAYGAGLPVGPLPAIGATPNGSAGDGATEDGAAGASAAPEALAGPPVPAQPTAPPVVPPAPAGPPPAPVPTTAPVTTPPVTTPPVTTPPVITSPPTTPPTTPPVTTPPVTTPPVTTPPQSTTTAPPTTTPPATISATPTPRAEASSASTTTAPASSAPAEATTAEATGAAVTSTDPATTATEPTCPTPATGPAVTPSPCPAP